MPPADFIATLDEGEIRREREKGRELRRSPWWKRRRSSGRCHWCGTVVAPDALTMDHIVPLVRGGRSTRGNVVPACKPCNDEKKHALAFEWQPRPAMLRQLDARLRGHTPVLAVHEPARRAAVAVVLAPEEAALRLLLIRRAEHPNDPWSGHMAFPGGRAEDEDADLVATAIRETREEIGLDLKAHGTLLTRLDDVQAYAGGSALDMVVSPFLFVLDQVRETVPDPREVAESLWVPMEHLLDPASHGTLSVDRAGLVADFPAFHIGPHAVWGLTFRMIRGLLDLVEGTFDGSLRDASLHQPEVARTRPN